MFVFLCALEFDPEGFAILDALPTSDFGTLSRRVNRVATLAGGAFLNDTGHTDADRDISVQFEYSEREIKTVKRLVRLYPLVKLSCIEGCFLGVIESLSPGNSDVVTLNFLVKERLDDGITG